MQNRKIAINILFFSLGLTVISGILAMAIPNSGAVLWRLLGTSIWTAFTAGILLLAIYRLQSPATRAFGASLGITTTLVYLIAISSIWIYLTPLVNLGSKLVMTGVDIGGCGLLISLGFLCIQHKKLRLAGFALSTIWAISLFTWLLYIWIFTGKSNLLLAQNFVFPLQTLFPIIVLCLIRRHIAYMIVASSFAIACCVLSQYALFTTQGMLNRTSTTLLEYILWTGGIGALLGIINIVQFRDAKYAIPWAERATIAITAVTITCLCISIWFDSYLIKLPEYLIRIAVGSAILSSASIIAIIVGQMLRASVFTNFDGEGIKGICPRCTSNLQIPKGKSRCPKCGLRMKLQIETPLCRKCGYDITKTSECSACPECGESILLSSTVQ